MTNEELQKLVKQISLTYFAKPFKHKAYFNTRLKTTGGRYHLKSHNIDINPKMLTDFSEKNLIGIIKHELCHYHLHLAGYSGYHRTLNFKLLLKAVNGRRYAPSPLHRFLLRYQCQKCHYIYLRKKRININRYVCGKCHGKLKLIGKEEK